MELFFNKNESRNSLEKCLVCEDDNAKMNYGVRCCDSCKIFFRRNVHLNFNTNQCKYNGNCLITKLTRHQCRICRLNKCLTIGMKKDLLRSPHGSQNEMKIKQEYSSRFHIHLLENNRSILTDNQWSLLSNITNAFNDRNPIGYIRYLISNQLHYPPKIRLKIANDHIMDIVYSIYVVIESFMKMIPEFLNMNINDQTTLIERNLRNIGGFNYIFIMHETDIINDFAYSNSLISIYGSFLFNETYKLVQNLENDGTLIKLLLIILSFSTCSDVVLFQSNSNQYNNLVNCILINTKELFQIQNIYIEIMFKYMIYRYGYEQSTLRFASLIKSFLYQSILTANTTDISIHELMIQTVVNKIEQSFILEDSIV